LTCSTNKLNSATTARWPSTRIDLVWLLFFEMLHNSILAFFVFELLVRLRQAGTRRFLMGRWNSFDTVVIALSFLPVLGVDASLLRVARMARLVLKSPRSSRKL
jgi:ion transport protein